jgi:1-acyl-sn-glycerol-3-phosphate acyltransferase
VIEKKRPSARRPSAAKRELAPAPVVVVPVAEPEVAPSPKKKAARARRSSPPAPAPKPARARRAKTPAVVAAPEPVALTEPEPREEDAIQNLEAEVDRLITDAGSIASDPQARRRAAEALSELAARLGGYEHAPVEREDSGLRGLFSTDYYVRQWGRLAMRNRSEQVDDFGLDRTYEGRFAPLFEALYRKWFRVAVHGVEHVPSEGRGMIVANHGGALPWDGLMVRTALRVEHPSQREARWLAEDFVYHMPFLGAFVTRVGAVRACQENAERLLAADELLTVFPEGIKGVGKLYRDRYQLQRFGRGGYVKLALRTGAPIIPTGIVGAEEAYPLLLRGNRTASLLGLPFLPITPLFPWLGPLGLLPLPSRWVIVFGPPIVLDGYDASAADDAIVVNRLNDEVRARVQELVQGALASRESAY